jgi:hypothetical protein
MFCPRCGSSQSEDLRFCKVCGANLYAVRQVVDTKDTEEKFDWNKTWVGEMFLSRQEALRQKEELERRRGITPEVKRYNEIKAGVIVSSVGIGLAIFLNVLMQGIILGGEVSPDEIVILSRIWVVGIIPLFVGLALILNGVFISKRLSKIARRAEQKGSNMLESETDPSSLRSRDTTEFIPSSFSVTEGTTRHLSGQKAEAGDQRPEARGQRTEVRGQRPENRDQTSNGRN